MKWQLKHNQKYDQHVLDWRAEFAAAAYRGEDWGDYMRRLGRGDVIVLR